MRWFSNLSLQKRIGLLVLFGLAVGLGLFSWLGIKSINESTQRVLDERLSIARIIARNLDDTLVHLLMHLEQDAHVMNESSPSPEFAAAAKSIRQLFSASDISVVNVMLTDKYGKVLQSDSEGNGIIGVDISQYAEVQRALETGTSAISNQISDSQIEEPVMLAVAPILDENGETGGLLVAEVQIQGSGIRALSQMMQIGSTGYIEVMDANGIVIARTDPGLPPRLDEKSDHAGHFADLISQGKTTVGTCHRCHETPSGSIQRRADVLAFAPLSSAPWGIAIRQSEDEALAPTRQLEIRLLSLGMLVLVITALLVWMMMRGVVKPVKMLTAAAKKVAAGDLKTAVPIRQRDEIGQLSEAFMTMTQELAKFRDELVSRNEELSALNSIAATVSQSLDIGDVLENSLQRVLEITKTNTGCVFLRSPDSQKLELMKSRGPANAFGCQESASPECTCACHKVMESGQTMMVNDISQCVVLGQEAMQREGIEYFVSLPLKSKNRTLGVMNIACSSRHCFTENDFKLLDSVGYHVGLAIENSFLYKEAKQKEQLRGQLLTSVISAQEEERKRIARELHDEYGQTLAGLVMSIELIENATPPGQVQVRDRLKDAKSLVIRAIDEIRRLTLDLRPSSLDYLGLVDTLHLYARSHLEAIGINVQFETKGLNQRLAPVVEVALFRIIQEALHNITKYAAAHNVRIKLEAKEKTILAEVEDDGKGFDTEAVLKNRMERKSLGLLGIEERATLLGGTFHIRSKPGRGTCLTIEIPIDQARSQTEAKQAIGEST